MIAIRTSGQTPIIKDDTLSNGMYLIMQLMTRRVQSYFVDSRPEWPHLRSGVISILGGLSGSIGSSIIGESGPDWARVSALATIHQTGGVIHHPGVGYESAERSWNLPKGMRRGKFALKGPGKLMVFIGRDGNLVFTTRVRPHLIREPQREYMVLPQEDIEQIYEIIPTSIVKGISYEPNA